MRRFVSEEGCEGGVWERRKEAGKVREEVGRGGKSGKRFE